MRQHRHSINACLACFRLSAAPQCNSPRPRRYAAAAAATSSVDWLVCAIIFILRHCCWFSSQSDIMPVSEWSLVYRVGRTAEYNKLPIRSFVQSVASLARWFPFAAAVALSMGATAAAAAPANTMSLAFLSSLRTNQPSKHQPTDRPIYPAPPPPPSLDSPPILYLYPADSLQTHRTNERTNVHECATFIHHPPNTLYQANYTGSSTTTTGALLYIFYCVCTTACATDRTKFILPNDSDVSPGQYIINSSDPIRSMHGW